MWWCWINNHLYYFAPALCRGNNFPRREACLTVCPLRAANLRISSTGITGNENHMTAYHSRDERGATLNIVASQGTYKMTRWNNKLIAMAPISQGFDEGAWDNSDSFSDKAFRALNISTTTKIVMLMVLGLRFFQKISQLYFSLPSLRPLLCWYRIEWLCKNKRSVTRIQVVFARSYQ